MAAKKLASYATMHGALALGKMEARPSMAWIKTQGPGIVLSSYSHNLLDSKTQECKHASGLGTKRNHSVA